MSATIAGILVSGGENLVTLSWGLIALWAGYKCASRLYRKCQCGVTLKKKEDCSMITEDDVMPEDFGEEDADIVIEE